MVFASGAIFIFSFIGNILSSFMISSFLVSSLYDILPWNQTIHLSSLYTFKIIFFVNIHTHYHITEYKQLLLCKISMKCLFTSFFRMFLRLYHKYFETTLENLIKIAIIKFTSDFLIGSYYTVQKYFWKLVSGFLFSRKWNGLNVFLNSYWSYGTMELQNLLP